MWTTNMRGLPRLVILSLCTESSPSQSPPSPPCSTDCAAEFQNCFNFHENQGAADPYTQCRTELDQQQGPLARCCTAGCADTASMEALAGPSTTNPAPAPSGPGQPLATGSFSIQQASLSRPVHVNVPPGAGPFPVQLLFHGNGGTGNNLLRRWARPSTLAWTDLRTTHVLVAPDGNANSWNIVNEASTVDDVAFVGLIIDYLATRSNVDANFVQLYGSSNGAALVNRLLIESTDTRIVRGVTEVSQLNDRQYRGGSFYVGGASNSYTQVATSLVRRELLSLQGGQDLLIPADGGPGLGGSLTMQSDADSIYAYALAYGYTGAQLSATDHTTYKSWVYLNGAVSSYTVYSAGHGVLGSEASPCPCTVIDEAVAAFLQRPAATAAPPSGPTAAPAPAAPPTAAPLAAPPTSPPPAAEPTTSPGVCPSGVVSGCTLTPQQRLARCSCRFEWASDCPNPVGASLACVE